MAFWSTNKWSAFASSDPRPPPLVTPFDPKKLSEAKYSLSVGGEYFMSESDPKNKTEKLKDGDSFFLQPGRFCYILTNEVVNIPQDAIGFISLKTGVKMEGIVNISGFHVDPGYSGNLVFAMFNAGPMKYEFKAGDALASLWIADLTSADAPPQSQGSYSSIPSKFTKIFSGSSYLNPFELRAITDKLNDEVANLKNGMLQYRFYVIAISLIIGIIVGVFVRPIVEAMSGGSKAGTININIPPVSQPIINQPEPNNSNPVTPR